MRVGILWRAEWDPATTGASTTDNCKLRGMFDALSTLGVEGEPVVYSDDAVDAVRAQLLGLDGVLVWVNPIEQGHDRSVLDPLLRDVGDSGVWVSAHPDVILKMGTKEVLYDTRDMSWSAETRIYRSVAELREHLPRRLASEGPKVLKQHRGMGGMGVWKVEIDPASTHGETPTLLVQHATEGPVVEALELDQFTRRCEPHFIGTGLMIEQPYQERLPDGMIRAYLTHDRVVGFTHQLPRGLMPVGPDDRPRTKLWEPIDEPKYQALRTQLEAQWIPEMQRILGLPTQKLPVIWDADFLYGPKTPSGEDTYVLCEINASSTFAFPEFAMPGVAQAAIARIDEHSGGEVKQA
jgi:hypothetical protein